MPHRRDVAPHRLMYARVDRPPRPGRHPTMVMRHPWPLLRDALSTDVKDRTLDSRHRRSWLTPRHSGLDETVEDVASLDHDVLLDLDKVRDLRTDPARAGGGRHRLARDARYAMGY